MVFKFALLVMIVILNSATDGKYLLVKLEAKLANKGFKLANKGFEAEQDNGFESLFDKGFESRENCIPANCKYISSSSYICGVEGYRYN